MTYATVEDVVTRYGEILFGMAGTTDEGELNQAPVLAALDEATAEIDAVLALAVAEAKAGTAGCLLITAETLLEVLKELDTIINIAQQVNTLGDFRLFGFRAADLPAGWHVCNGGGFATSSAQGKALAALPANFKTDWKVTVSGSTIYKPNLLTGGAVSGQGPFFRPSTSTPGTLVQDAIRNITGDSGELEIQGTSTSGAFTTKNGTSARSSTWVTSKRLFLDVSGSVPTAAENRPFHVSMTPAIWLGC